MRHNGYSPSLSLSTHTHMHMHSHSHFRPHTPLFSQPPAPTQVTQTFLLKGSQPGLTVYHSETVASGLIAYDGTTEHVECSNRGLCNRKRGLCECFENFFPSDGLGK